MPFKHALPALMGMASKAVLAVMVALGLMFEGSAELSLNDPQASKQASCPEAAIGRALHS